MQRAQSPDTMMVTFYDLNRPLDWPQGYRLQSNTQVSDVLTYIKKSLNNDQRIELQFEKNKPFDGRLDTQVINIMKQLKTRQIFYRKIYSYTIQKLSSVEQGKQISFNQQFDNQIHQFKQEINSNELYYIDNLQLSSQIPILNGTTTQNYINFDQSKIEQSQKSEQLNTSEIIGKKKIHYIENPKYFIYLNRIQIYPQNQQIIQQQQQYSSELQQLKQEKQQIEQQYFQLQKDLSQIKNLSQVYEQQISQSKIEISNLTKEINELKLLNNKYDKECQNLNNENLSLQNEFKQTKLNLQSQTELLKKERDNEKKLTQDEIKKLQEENQKLKNENLSLQNEFQQAKFKLQSQLLQLTVLNQERDNERKLTQDQIKKLQEENQKLKNENISLQNQLKQTKFNLQSQIEVLNKEIDNEKQLTQNNINKLQEENQKLKNQNLYLQNEFKQTKLNLQSQIEKLKKERDNEKKLTQNNINKLQEENQKLKNENISLQTELKETKFNLQSQLEVLNQERDKQNNEQQVQIENLRDQNTQLEKSLKKFEKNFITICGLMNIQTKKILERRIDNHDCISNLTFREIKDVLESALIMQKQVHCKCYKEKLLPLNLFQQLLILLEQYLKMIYQKQLLTLIRIQRNAQLPIYKCNSKNCNFIFIFQSNEENQEIKMNQQFYCQNCEQFCKAQKI
ncbi:unnamed protein product [Paramecium pentaurelia]|uniref:Uncharacterized protein n=1 Tax=Paramecium pentaurelia TaxID=43138 RepID=A0A8S1TX49_9CILI|nr:unnamed protein product [Paramecium pentaurelia]